jgi:hypothetical protein
MITGKTTDKDVVVQLRQNVYLEEDKPQNCHNLNTCIYTVYGLAKKSLSL